MNEFIEKLIGRLEEEAEQSCVLGDIDVWYDGMESGFLGAIEIVNELAEEHKDKVMINEQYCWQTCGATEHCKECNRLCNGSIDYYENYDFMAEEHKGGWIPCSERLPDTEHISGVSESVLVTTNIHSIFTAEYHRNGKWLDDVGDWSLDVIAWQPLPPVFKPKGE